MSEHQAVCTKCHSHNLSNLAKDIRIDNFKLYCKLKTDILKSLAH